MKKLLLILFILALGASGYFGFHRAPEKTVMILDARLQGRKVLAPGQWSFVAESVIPGWVKILKFPSALSFQGKIRIELPCLPILNSLSLCYAEAGYEALLAFEQESLPELMAKTPEEIQKEIQTRIENHIRQTLFSQLKNPDFDAEQWKTALKEKNFEKVKALQYQIFFLPHWQNFVQISRKMDLALSYASEKELLETLLEHQKKVLAFELEMKKWQDQFDFIMKMAEKISLSGHKDLILKLLQDFKGAAAK
jgi:hypothetical protein